MSITVNATEREDQGKGASRRLRKEEKVPSIIYGGKKDPLMVTLSIHEITHLLEDENTFTSVLDLVVGKSTESVVLKDIQRHPAKNTITHVDFLRVDAKQTLVTTTPLHFVGIVLPEGVTINALQHEDVEAHDQTVCSVSEPKVIEEEEEIIEDGESEEGGEDSAEDSADSADGDSKDGDDNE